MKVYDYVPQLVHQVKVLVLAAATENKLHIPEDIPIDWLIPVGELSQRDASHAELMQTLCTLLRSHRCNRTEGVE